MSVKVIERVKVIEKESQSDRERESQSDRECVCQSHRKRVKVLERERVKVIERESKQSDREGDYSLRLSCSFYFRSLAD